MHEIIKSLVDDGYQIYLIKITPKLPIKIDAIKIVDEEPKEESAPRAYKKTRISQKIIAKIKEIKAEGEMNSGQCAQALGLPLEKVNKFWN